MTFAVISIIVMGLTIFPKLLLHYMQITLLKSFLCQYLSGIDHSFRFEVSSFNLIFLSYFPASVERLLQFHFLSCEKWLLMAVLLTVIINKQENNSLVEKKHLIICFVFYYNRFLEAHLRRSTTDKHTHT